MGGPRNIRKKEGEAGQVFPPPLVSPFRGKPVSLTEGGWPVLCWPAYETPAGPKKFHVHRRKMVRIPTARQHATAH